MSPSLPDAVRTQVLEHVLREVHPDRRAGEVVGSIRADDGLLVGVKLSPRGFFSTATYALVTVDEDGRVVDARPCTGQELRRTVEPEEG